MDAAGGVRCSIHDMMIWATNWLAPTEQQLAWLTPEQRHKEWTAYTPMPISARRRAWDGTLFYGYGYGWRIADMDGQMTVSHTGTLSGMYSATMLLPFRKSGFMFMINADADDARTVLIEVLTKQFTAPDKMRSVDDYADEIAREEQQKRVARVPDTSARKPATPADLKDELGVWRDPWLGEMNLCAKGNTVRIAAREIAETGRSGHARRRQRFSCIGITAMKKRGCTFRNRKAACCISPKSIPPPISATISKTSPSRASTPVNEGFVSAAVARRQRRAAAAISPATTMAQAGMVDIRTLVPDIVEDIKYAGRDNFTGAPVPGYSAAKCFLLKCRPRMRWRMSEQTASYSNTCG